MLRMRVRSVLTSGGVECILGVLLFLVAINGWFSGIRHGTWNPWWDAVTLALLFAMTRWPRAGLAAMMVAACAGMAIDPIGYGMYHFINACAVAMTVRRGQFAMAVVGTVFFGCLLFYTSYGRAEPGQVVAVVASTLIMYATAWGLGLGIRGIVRAEVARVEAAHRERQFALAADLHDFVARNLTGLALAASSFPERMDRASAEDLGERARMANASLRVITEAMRGEVDDRRPVIGVEQAFRQGSEDIVRHRGVVHAGEESVALLRALPEDVDLIAGRILAEALHNALRHGDLAHPCLVVVEQTDVVLDIVVTNRIRRKASTGMPTMGIYSMVQHAAVIGGRAESAGQGDTWVCTASLPNKRAAEVAS